MKALSDGLAPVCSVSGALCDNEWYKLNLPSTTFDPNQKDKSIHSKLKQISTSYTISKECFEANQYPSFLKPSDFTKCSVESFINSEPNIVAKDNDS